MLMFLKVDKKIATKLFNEGKSIYLLPNKVRVDNMWIQPFEVNNNHNDSLDSIINAYAYYNCNSELGNRVSFYRRN